MICLCYPTTDLPRPAISRSTPPKRKDWGWFNNGFHGNKLAQTPDLDALVEKESLVLHRHYAYKFCSPTRRSFLSGRVPPHSGQDNSAAATVDIRMKTIADKLQGQGYSTHQSGKWHAGHQSVFQTPKGRGFNTSLGYFNGACDHWTQVDGEDRCKGKTTDIWNTDRPGFGLNGTYGDLMYVGRAVETIQAHDGARDGPLFYYLAMQCAHDPMEAPQRFLDQYDKDVVPNQVEYAFSAVINEGIRNVTEALKAKGLWDNTLMVVSSDNGGPAFSDQHAASNYPLRGGKYTYFEGGLRVNAFVTGGLLPKAARGGNTSSPVHISDWYGTFAKLAGADPSDDHEGVPSVDSVDQWPMISSYSSNGHGHGNSDDDKNGGNVGSTTREIFAGSGVLIQGDWKLIAAGAGADKWSGPMYPKVPATEKPTVSCSAKKPCLFNVVQDPSERHEVAAKNPALVANMTARLNELMKGVFEGHGPNITSQQVCAMTAKNGGYLTPGDWQKKDEL